MALKIGLEVHGYLLTREKLFCSCKAEHGLKKVSPNVNIWKVINYLFLPFSNPAQTQKAIAKRNKINAGIM